jgi:molybdopterin-guanine dinucleotide biosynthesis protein A
MNWSAAILAGGQARRLGGQDKTALIVDGSRFLERQIAALCPLTDTIVLVGYCGHGPAPLPVEPDRWPGTGPLGGIVTALAAAVGDRVLVLAGDLPFVTTPFLAYLVTVEPAAAAVIPVLDGRWHPLCAVYARRALDVLSDALARGEREVARAVTRLDPRLVGVAELAPFDADGGLLANINTPDDMARWNISSPPIRAAHHDRVRADDRTAAPETSQTTPR